MQPAPEQGSAVKVPPTGSVGGAGGVVFDPRGHVLVIRHAEGQWVFPKGHLERGETELEAALREVAEEAGVRASCPQPQRSWITTYRNAHGTWRHITWFACRTDTSAVQPLSSKEPFDEAVFLPPADALARLTFDADRQLLQRVLAEAGPFREPA